VRRLGLPKQGIRTIGLIGQDGKLASLVELALVVRAETARIRRCTV
jgi:hypothetical protein